MKNNWYHAKVLLKRFHLNGHTIGFHQQTQKLKLHYVSPYMIDSESERVDASVNSGNAHVPPGITIFAQKKKMANAQTRGEGVERDRAGPGTKELCKCPAV